MLVGWMGLRSGHWIILGSRYDDRRYQNLSEHFRIKNSTDQLHQQASSSKVAAKRAENSDVKKFSKRVRLRLRIGGVQSGEIIFIF